MCFRKKKRKKNDENDENKKKRQKNQKKKNEKNHKKHKKIKKNEKKTKIYKNEFFLLKTQECSLMFFQKNIFWDIELDKRFKVNRTTCFVFIYLSNFQLFFFSIHLLFFYYYLHWSCSLTICLSCHYIYLSIVFNLFEKLYRNEDQDIDEKDEVDEMKINLVLRFLNLLLSYADYIINLHR